jgi:hypothetical protein
MRRAGVVFDMSIRIPYSVLLRIDAMTGRICPSTPTGSMGILCQVISIIEHRSFYFILDLLESMPCQITVEGIAVGFYCRTMERKSL